jgi:hypothetical protein
MEHWQKVAVGTVGGIVGTVIFYFFFGKLLEMFYVRKKRRMSTVQPRPERYFSKKKGGVAMVFLNCCDCLKRCCRCHLAIFLEVNVYLSLQH